MHFDLDLLLEEIHGLTHIDPWFLAQIEDLVNTEKLISRNII